MNKQFKGVRIEAQGIGNCRGHLQGRKDCMWQKLAQVLPLITIANHFHGDSHDFKLKGVLAIR